MCNGKINSMDVRVYAFPCLTTRALPFMRPFEKRSYYAIVMSLRSSFPGYFSTCFEIPISNLVYILSRQHDMSRFSFITIGSFWHILLLKICQTKFFQSLLPRKLIYICQIGYMGSPRNILPHKFFVCKNRIFRILVVIISRFWISKTFSGLFSACYKISIWNVVYMPSRQHHTSAIKTVWPTLKKVGQIRF